MTELTILKVVRQVHHNIVLFATISISQIKGLIFNQTSAMVFMIY